MAKKTIVTEVASALGAAVARVETLKPKRSTGTKHSKAKSVPEPLVGGVAEPTVFVGHDEIARTAYLYWEARGGRGGSADEDWIAAERELRANAAAK